MVDAGVLELVAEIRKKREELMVKRELLKFVRIIFVANKMLESVKKALKNGRFGFPGERLKELKVTLT
ncbi:hypothetical protein AHAS_Ahas04G0083300 [Arachis hypogaea]